MVSNTHDASMLASWTKGDTTVRGLYLGALIMTTPLAAGAMARRNAAMVLSSSIGPAFSRIGRSRAPRRNAPRQLGIAIDLPFAIAHIGTRQVCLHELRPRGAHGIGEIFDLSKQGACGRVVVRSREGIAL
jgi:hypothetical protein